MKNTLITLAALALCLPAGAQASTISTTDGVTYADIKFERVEPDGLYIEYPLPGGGLGMSKIKFNRLSRAEQKKFGFDSEAAHDYEAEITTANNNAAQELM